MLCIYHHLHVQMIITLNLGKIEKMRIICSLKLSSCKNQKANVVQNKWIKEFNLTCCLQDLDFGRWSFIRLLNEANYESVPPFSTNQHNHTSLFFLGWPLIAKLKRSPRQNSHLKRSVIQVIWTGHPKFWILVTRSVKFIESHSLIPEKLCHMQTVSTLNLIPAIPTPIRHKPIPWLLQGQLCKRG